VSAENTVSTTEELFYVVDVGDPSERQTRQIYREATATLNIMTKSFEYIDSVEPALEAALESEITVRILFTDPDHLSEANAEIQREVLDRIETAFPDIDYKFSDKPTPWRGTIADPNRAQATAIFLVGQKDIPLHMRQAAITEDESFIAGMNRYFTLIWEYESFATPS